MQIPAMFKPIIKSLLSGISLKIDAEKKLVRITKSEQVTEISFDEFEKMVNNGEIG